MVPKLYNLIYGYILSMSPFLGKNIKSQRPETFFKQLARYHTVNESQRQKSNTSAKFHDLSFNHYVFFCLFSDYSLQDNILPKIAKQNTGGPKP